MSAVCIRCKLTHVEIWKCRCVGGGGSSDSLIGRMRRMPHRDWSRAVAAHPSLLPNKNRCYCWRPSTWSDLAGASGSIVSQVGSWNVETRGQAVHEHTWSPSAAHVHVTTRLHLRNDWLPGGRPSSGCYSPNPRVLTGDDPQALQQRGPPRHPVDLMASMLSVNPPRYFQTSINCSLSLFCLLLMELPTLIIIKHLWQMKKNPSHVSNHSEKIILISFVKTI